MYKLSDRDLHAVKIWQKYNSDGPKEQLQDYHRLLDTLIFLNEILSEKKIAVPQWLKESETILKKFLFHGTTIHQIYAGVTLNSTFYQEVSGSIIIDFASAKVILRSQLETFLMFHHIYVNGANDDAKQLRYYAWYYASLHQRQGFPATTDFAKAQKEKDLTEMENIRQAIQKLDTFRLITPGQQQALLKEGNGKLFRNWAQLLSDVGFVKGHVMSDLYTMLSIYTHTEALSILQMSQHDAEFVAYQRKLDLHHSKLLVCMMAVSLCNLHPFIKERFDNLPDATRWDIEIYHQMILAAGPK